MSIDLQVEANKIQVTIGLHFTDAMKDLLTRAGYTETEPGEWWFLGEPEGDENDEQEL